MVHGHPGSVLIIAYIHRPFDISGFYLIPSPAFFFNVLTILRYMHVSPNSNKKWSDIMINFVVWLSITTLSFLDLFVVAVLSHIIKHSFGVVQYGEVLWLCQYQYCHSHSQSYSSISYLNRIVSLADM